MKNPRGELIEDIESLVNSSARPDKYQAFSVQFPQSAARCFAYGTLKMETSRNFGKQSEVFSLNIPLPDYTTLSKNQTIARVPLKTR